MQKLIWTNSDGDSIDLTSGNYGITNWEGFSNTSLNIQSQQVPFQDGGVFLDALLEQRELSVTLAMQDNGNLEDRYRMRRELIHALNPKLGEGYLIYKNDFIEKRIKCVAQVPLFETHNSNDSGTPKATLVWNACDPYWEDLEETEMIIFPNLRKNIKNEGDVSIGVQIECINQGVTDFEICNYTEEKVIKITGEENEEIFIDTTLGNKKVLTETRMTGFSVFGYNITKICYSEEKDLYVAIGNDRSGNVSETTGCVLVSKDLNRWELISVEVSFYPVSVIYAKGQHKFVIAYTASNTGGIKYSEDGYNWTDGGYITPAGNPARGIAYSDDLDLYVFVANNFSVKSTDLESWEDAGAEVNLPRDIVYVNGNFIIIGNSCKKSSDGENWNDVTKPSATYYCISYLEGIGYVIGGANGKLAFSSLALSSFTEVNSPFSVTTDVTGIASCRNIGFYAIAGTNVAFSVDGENWNIYRTTSNIQNGVLFSYKLGDFITYGRGGTINSLLTDAISIIGMDNTLTDIEYVDHLGMYIVTSLDGYIYKSKDLNKWDKQSISSNQLFSIAYSKEKEVIVITGYEILVSTDGENWNNVMSARFTCVRYLDYYKKFLAVGYGGGKISEDGYNWTSTSLPSIGVTNVYMDIAINKNRVIVVGYKEAYTDDLQTWTQVDTSFDSVAFSDLLNCYVALDRFRIYKSTNGINWKEILYSTNLFFHNVGYSSYQGIFNVCGRKILQSMDADTWNELDSYFGLCDLYKIKYFEKDNKTVAVGNAFNNGRYGAIFVIDNVISRNIINKLSNKSDLTLELKKGDNIFLAKSSNGNFVARVKYRQKYIGV